MTTEVGSSELARLTAALKQAELLQHLSVEILQFLNGDLGFADVLNAVLAAIKRSTGLEALAIRLRDGDDFPYCSENGFSSEFLSTENTLVARSRNGDICRNKQGKACLECTCGLVISGQTDPTNPLFTPNGSCWFNRGWESPGFPQAHDDPRLNARNRCLHEGFNSVALIPIRAHQEIVGLLRLNDRKRDCFTLEMIEFFEGLCAGIGLVLTRKQAEETLRDRKEQLLEAQRLAHIGNWAIDPVTKERTWSPEMFCIFGVDPRLGAPNLLGEDKRLVHADDYQLVESALRQAVELGKPYELELRICRDDGSEGTVVTICKPQCNAAGKVVRLCGTVQVITERKRIEAELNQSHDMLAKLTAQVPGVVYQYVLHPDGSSCFPFSSPGMQTIYEVTPEEVRLDATPVFGMLHPEDATDVGNLIMESARTLQLFHCEFRVMLPRQGLRWRLSDAVPERMPDGGTLWYGIISDVTDRKLAEIALRDKHTELERFTYAVSHDLKSPLVTIQTFLGYVEQDLERNDAAGVEKDCGFIRNAAGKMSQLLDELLKLSRVGRLTNPSVEVPLLAVVNDALSLVAGRISARGIAVEVTGESIFLFGDRARLVELFQNLLDNAAKFMGEQPMPYVEVGVEVDVEAARDGIVLFVRDNGIGIEPQHCDRLFGLFERLDSSMEGTGIGLTLVRQIVELHGGKIWGESDGPGTGATFRFTLARTRRALVGDKEPMP